MPRFPTGVKNAAEAYDDLKLMTVQAQNLIPLLDDLITAAG